jgi:hypothetical protein
MNKQQSKRRFCSQQCRRVKNYADYIFLLLRLTKQSFEIKYNPLAEVAELADALGSGLSERKLVRVQVPPSALPMVAGQKLAEKRVFLFSYHPLLH